MTFRVAVSTTPDSQGSSWVDKLTHPYTTAACSAGVLAVTTGRDIARAVVTTGTEGYARKRWVSNTNDLN